MSGFVSPRDYPPGLEQCETEMCVAVAVDEIRFDRSYGGKQFDFMRGYEPASIVEMMVRKRIDIRDINRAAYILGIMGYSKPLSGDYGDMHSAVVWYDRANPLWRYILAHEFYHAQGFAERYGSTYGPTPGQRIIMEEDGVDDWTDTNMYKNQDDKYHYMW